MSAQNSIKYTHCGSIHHLRLPIRSQKDWEIEYTLALNKL
jgi:hypothetical protein